MKRAAILILPIFILAFWATLRIQAAAPDDEPRFTDVTIDPGLHLGPLKLGDNRDRALELFPKKDVDQEWDDPCGKTLDWVDTTNSMGHGDVYVRINKKGKIFQIESSTTRFHTPEGITTFDPPEKVRMAYKDMRAYVLLTPPSPALGSRPLVFWLDKKRGIAFALAYDPPHRKRYIYKIIVFEGNKDFCPEQDKTSSNNWHPIQPYAVEPPPELSPESQ
jgi:hypothetical protein